MASFHLSLPLVISPINVISNGVALESLKLKAFSPQFLLLKTPKSHNLNPPRASTNGAYNGSIEPSKPTHVRKKGTTYSSEALKKPRHSKKSEVVNGTVEPQPENPDSELEDYDDDIDFPYDYLPLVCCFGAAQKEFVPTVRVSDNRMHPDIYSQWKMLRWDPPMHSDSH